MAPGFGPKNSATGKEKIFRALFKSCWLTTTAVFTKSTSSRLLLLTPLLNVWILTSAVTGYLIRFGRTTVRLSTPLLSLTSWHRRVYAMSGTHRFGREAMEMSNARTGVSWKRFEPFTSRSATWDLLWTSSTGLPFNTASGYWKDSEQPPLSSRYWNETAKSFCRQFWSRRPRPQCWIQTENEGHSWSPQTSSWPDQPTGRSGSVTLTSAIKDWKSFPQRAMCRRWSPWWPSHHWDAWWCSVPKEHRAHQTLRYASRDSKEWKEDGRGPDTTAWSARSQHSSPITTRDSHTWTIQRLCYFLSLS